MALPAPHMIEAGLRGTTETLARELAHPGSIAPNWSPFEWRVARAVAAMHGVSSLLAVSLRWRGPVGWESFLREQRFQTAARHSRLQELLQSLDRAARSADLAVVALKGAELHAMGLYAPGDRPMADIDLLVQRAGLERMAGILTSLGFTHSFANWKHQVFVMEGSRPPRAFGEHAENHLKVEVHWQIGEALPAFPRELTQRILPADAHPGLNRYASKAALLGHLLLHAAGCMAHRDLRLLHLHDIARLSEHMSDAEWDEFLRVSLYDESQWWAYPPLRLTATYFDRSVPTRSLVALASRCPRLLRAVARRRSLSDVSLSYPWLNAFPGIEWAQTLPEALRYVFSRVRPSPQTLDVRTQLARTQRAAASSPWQRLSQSRRLFYWLLFRSSRVRTDTIHAVRMALSQST